MRKMKNLVSLTVIAILLGCNSAPSQSPILQNRSQSKPTCFSVYTEKKPTTCNSISDRNILTGEFVVQMIEKWALGNDIRVEKEIRNRIKELETYVNHGNDSSEDIVRNLHQLSLAYRELINVIEAGVGEGKNDVESNVKDELVTLGEKEIITLMKIKGEDEEYQRLDEVLFLAGLRLVWFSYQQQPQEKSIIYIERSRSLFQNIIRTFPKSKFVPGCWFLFGQNYFERSDYERSLKAFSKSLDTGGLSKELNAIAKARVGIGFCKIDSEYISEKPLVDALEYLQSSQLESRVHQGICAEIEDEFKKNKK